MRREAFLFFAVALGAGAPAALAPGALAAAHDALIAKHATANGVPERLVRRVIRIESRGNAALVHAGNYGLMQIRLGTARAVGYRGDAKGLLDPDTNLTYAVKYLAGAYRVAGCDADRAVSFYMRGYRGSAKRTCAESPAEAVQLAQARAQAETTAEEKPRRGGASAKSKRGAASTEPADVIKPKVVRTETIATPQSGPAPARPVGPFEPARIAPPPVQPVEAALSTPVNPASETKADKLAPAAASLELAAVPLPPARRELEPPPPSDVQPPRNSKRTGKAAKVATAGDPDAVVTFLKKLVTPDTKSRKRSARAKADPPSPVHTPQ